MAREIEGFVWDGSQHSYVDENGKAVSREKDMELGQKALALYQAQIMERLDDARATFEAMSGQSERKAALKWLCETYSLKS